MTKLIYIAGPMRGYPRFNFDAFHAAERELNAQGWETLNPARVDEEDGFDPDTAVVTPADMLVFMRRDFEMIMLADAVAVLPGWEKSTGATAEVALARWKGIPVYAYPGMQELKIEDAQLLTIRYPN